MRYILLIGLGFILLTASGQDKLDFGDTETTNKSPTYEASDKKHKKKRPIEWVKNSPQGLLIGNRCMEEVFDQMGFIYVVQTKNQRTPHSYMNEFDRFWHNLASKLRITFKNGPFWKFKLKKKRKECRELSGDFVG